MKALTNLWRVIRRDPIFLLCGFILLAVIFAAFAGLPFYRLYL